MKWNILCVAVLGLLALSNGFKLFDRTRTNGYGTEKRGQQQEVMSAEKRGRRPDVVALIADRIDQQLMNCYNSPQLDDYVYTNRDVLQVLVTLLREECPENGGYTDGYSTTSDPAPTYMYPYGKKRTFVKEIAEILKQRGFDHTSGPDRTEENESYFSNSGSITPGFSSGTSQSDEEFSNEPRPTGLPSDFEWE